MDEEKKEQNAETMDASSEETVEGTEEVKQETVQTQQEEAAETKDTSTDAALDAMKQQYLRLQADFMNFKKRTAGEKLQISEVVKMDILGSMLPILDNFERALQVPQDKMSDDIQSFLDGYQMIYNQLMTVLQKEGLQKMDAVGKPFDPNYHQAVMRMPNEEYADDTIIEVLQDGYLLGEKTLRPAMVKVAFNG